MADELDVRDAVGMEELVKDLRVIYGMKADSISDRDLVLMALDRLRVDRPDSMIWCRTTTEPDMKAGMFSLVRIVDALMDYLALKVDVQDQGDTLSLMPVNE